MGYQVDRAPRPFHRKSRPGQQALAFAPFDARSLATLTLLFDHLLPGDPELGLPSAGEVGVTDYVNQTAAAPGFLAIRNELIRLIRTLDLLSKKHFKNIFKAIEGAARENVILRLSQGEGRQGRFYPTRALHLAMRLGVEGYLSHPHHGGNTEHRAWEALRIPMPRHRSPHHHR